eukprot:g83314.t1
MRRLVKEEQQKVQPSAQVVKVEPAQVVKVEPAQLVKVEPVVSRQLHTLLLSVSTMESLATTVILENDCANIQPPPQVTDSKDSKSRDDDSNSTDTDEKRQQPGVDGVTASEDEEGFEENLRWKPLQENLPRLRACNNFLRNQDLTALGQHNLTNFSAYHGWDDMQAAVCRTTEIWLHTDPAKRATHSRIGMHVYGIVEEQPQGHVAPEKLCKKKFAHSFVLKKKYQCKKELKTEIMWSANIRTSQSMTVRSHVIVNANEILMDSFDLYNVRMSKKDQRDLLLKLAEESGLEDAAI